MVKVQAILEIIAYFQLELDVNPPSFVFYMTYFPFCPSSGEEYPFFQAYFLCIFVM